MALPMASRRCAPKKTSTRPGPRPLQPHRNASKMRPERMASDTCVSLSRHRLLSLEDTAQKVSARMFDSTPGKTRSPYLRGVGSTELIMSPSMFSLVTIFFLPVPDCSTGGQDFDMSDFGFGDRGGFGGFGDPFKIFEEHFGGSFGGGSFGGGGSSRRSMRESAARHPPVQKPLPCTLEELYVRIIFSCTLFQLLDQFFQSMMTELPRMRSLWSCFRRC